MSDGTIPPRDGEGLDEARLLAFLRARLDGVPEGPLEVRQFPTGASNLTYLLRVGAWEAVLRRPPLGPVAPKAHDMVREGALLRRLHPVYPLAPRPLLVVDDRELIGAPFQVVERRRGAVIDARLPEGVEPSPETGRRIARGAVDALAALHAVDLDAAGMGDISRGDGFLERQLGGWIGRYERARTEEVAEVEPLLAWLRARRPADRPMTVIHNDFKLNNLLFDPADVGRVTAVLDWEMATVGDPLLDLAVFLGYWIEAGDPPELRALLPSVTTLPGFPGRAELAWAYADASGRDVAGLGWYQTFAYFKLAVIVQQIYARWVHGQTRDPRFAGFGRAAATLVAHALSTSSSGDSA